MIRGVSTIVVGACLALAGCGTTGDGATSASTSTTSTTAAPPDQVLRTDGLGPIRLGMPVEDLEATGLVGELTPGCPLVDPPPLAAPLVDVGGSVEVEGGVVRAITVTGAVVTEPGGVAPGDPLDAATAAWEQAGLQVTVDEGSEDVFGVWFVDVRQGGEPAFGTTVEPASRTLGPISVPQVFACE